MKQFFWETKLSLVCRRPLERLQSPWMTPSNSGTNATKTCMGSQKRPKETVNWTDSRLKCKGCFPSNPNASTKTTLFSDHHWTHCLKKNLSVAFKTGHPSDYLAHKKASKPQKNMTSKTQIELQNGLPPQRSP